MDRRRSHTCTIEEVIEEISFGFQTKKYFVLSKGISILPVREELRQKNGSKHSKLNFLSLKYIVKQSFADNKARTNVTGFQVDSSPLIQRT